MKTIVGRTVIRKCLHHAAAVITTSDLESDRLVSFGSRPSTAVIPLPVVKPGEGDGESFRSAHGIPSDAIVVLFLGRIDYKKGLDFLFPALSALKKDYPALWLLVAGTGDPKALRSMERLAERCGLGAWTTFAGFLSGSEKAGAFLASDLFALPSLNENFGIALIEAMYSGLPLVVSDEVYIGPTLAAGGAAIVCERSIDGCRAGLSRLLASSSDRKVMGVRAQSLADSLFRPELATAALLGLYSGFDRGRC